MLDLFILCHGKNRPLGAEGHFDSACVWAALRRIGIKEPVKGFGKLMEKY